MGDFEKWFKGQDFYTNMRFIHGDRLFDKDGDVYRVLPVQIAYQGWNARQSEIEQIKAEIEGLKNPNLAQHTKKYREQCELFKSMSEVEKKAYSAGYDWACKVSQRQILTLIKDQEGVEDKLDDEIDSLKAQLECCRKENAVLLGKVGEGEKRVSELNQWNSNQYELIKRNESHTQSLRHLLQKLIHDDYTTMRPSMAYEIQEALRGAND